MVSHNISNKDVLSSNPSALTIDIGWRMATPVVWTIPCVGKWKWCGWLDNGQNDDIQYGQGKWMNGCVEACSGSMIGLAVPTEG